MPFSEFIIKEIKHYYNYDNHGNANNHLEIDNSYFGYNFSSIGTIYETIEYFEKYRFGFNTQEKVDEVYGKGNLNTALFWEYDTRLGRRWNLDPKPNPSISDYACFANNPLIYTDEYGDSIRFDKFRDKINSTIARMFSKGYREKYNSWKQSDDTYFITKTPNSPSIFDTNPQKGNSDISQEGNASILTEYSNIGITLPSIPYLGVNINITIPRKIESKNKLNDDDRKFVLRNLDMTSPITFNPYGHPDELTSVDENGNITRETYVNRANRTYDNVSPFGVPINIFGNGMRNRMDDNCIAIMPTSRRMTLSVISTSPWGFVDDSGNKDFSVDSRSNFRIEYRQVIFRIKF